MKSVWKQPLFIMGFAILGFFLIGSFVFEWVFGNEPKQTLFIEDNGRVVEAPPISPNLNHPLGTDSSGYDMFAKIMLGGKYTILAAMAVAALRMLIAVPLGFMLGTYFQRHRSWINGLIDPLHYVPMTIFTLIFLTPILWMPPEGFSTTIFERIVIQIVIMAFITVPIVASLIGNESNLLYNEEYILAARTLGASRRRIIIRHLFPQVREKLFVLYGQQVVETLIVFAHLGVFKLFLGGTAVDYDNGSLSDPPRSMAYEWAGLFGNSFWKLQLAPWLPLGPVICFSLVIVAISAMIEGYIRATNGLVKMPKRKKMAFVVDEVIEWNQQQFKQKMRLIESGKKE